MATDSVRKTAKAMDSGWDSATSKAMDSGWDSATSKEMDSGWDQEKAKAMDSDSDSGSDSVTVQELDYWRGFADCWA